jgi:hypothetical protein
MMQRGALLFALCAVGVAHGQSESIQKGAPADASLEELVKAKARTIPGTGIRYVVAGYLQLDTAWTRRQLEGDEKDTFLVSAIPFGDADSGTRASIRASQINALAQMPTALGELTALMQVDLFTYEAGARPNLTQLVARLGNWLGVGKTYSTFMDDEAWPTTLDYNGPSGAVFVRQLIVRGGVSLPAHLRLEASLEDPQADASAEGEGLSVSAKAERPDFVARLRYGGERVHAQLASLSREVVYTANLPSGSVQRRVSGYGVSASAAIQVAEEDRLLVQWNKGQGVSRYFNDGLSGLGTVYDAGGRLEPLRLIGAYLYYERKWAPRWKSVTGVSTLRSDSEGLRPASDLRRIDYVSANLIHRLSASLFVGGEVLWGRAERVDSTRANDTRVQLTARYYLY